MRHCGESLILIGVVIVAFGWPAAVAQPDGAAIVAKGDNQFGQSTPPSANNGYIAVAAGARHSLGLKQICRGDLNCDEFIDFGDINPFVLLFSSWGWEEYQRLYPDCPPQNGDFNENGAHTFDDINGFVSLLAGSGGHPIQCP